MKRNLFSLVTGIVLILIGALSLLGNTVLDFESWQMWPVIVVLLGLGMTAAGFFGFKQPGFGGFFIPGLPILAVGGILMYASLTGDWGIWAWAWSLIVIAFGLGFGLAGVFLRAPGLAIPAFIVGLTGLTLGFTAFTGQWAAWALLWPVEPLSIGLGLLTLGGLIKSRGTLQAGVILCAIAGAGLFITGLASSRASALLSYILPGLLILTGLVVLATIFLGREKKDAPVQ